MKNDDECDLEHLNNLVMTDVVEDLQAFADKHRNDPNPTPLVRKILDLIPE
jgi:hypothetical protein